MKALLIVAVPAFLTLVGTLLTVAFASRAKNSESAVKIMELGMTKFVEGLERQLANCEGRCEEFEADIAELKDAVKSLTGEAEDKDAEIIRLKWKAGELP